MNSNTTRYAITGSGGFLGFHTRALLHSSGRRASSLAVGESFDESTALAAADGSDRLIHIAGVNRGTDVEIREGNLKFAKQLARVILECEFPPPVVVYANSTQAGNESVYGDAKKESAGIIDAAAAAVGSTFVDIHLPNLFGEHGRPFYNSVAATFCHIIARGGTPDVKEDRQLTMLHAQNAAEVLVGDRTPGAIELCTSDISVSQLRDRITAKAEIYRTGSIPDLTSEFDRDLFNTYRSYLQPQDRVFKLNRHADNRGSFFEVIRSHGGSGQTSFSTTVPGITRGEHYHLRKIERFTVLAGRGRIAMRKLFSNDVMTFDISGDEPVAIDMPTMWAHNVSNTSSDLLYTMFWSNEFFDPGAPDTFPEDV